jgi:hypothetical protein
MCLDLLTGIYILGWGRGFEEMVQAKDHDKSAHVCQESSLQSPGSEVICRVGQNHIIHTAYIYGLFGREITKYTVHIYGLFGREITEYTVHIYAIHIIWFWPTLVIC